MVALHISCISKINFINFNDPFIKLNESILKVNNKHAPMRKASRKQKRLLIKP